jgi:hypothetical protein
VSSPRSGAKGPRLFLTAFRAVDTRATLSCGAAGRRRVAHCVVSSSTYPKAEHLHAGTILGMGRRFAWPMMKRTPGIVVRLSKVPDSPQRLHSLVSPIVHRDRESV